MTTYFAPSERANAATIAMEIEAVSGNEIVTGLLHSISGLLAILNEHRQIVALNHSFLQMIGIEDPAEALGLRPGEAVRCVHAHEEPAGCGTTEFCSTCGAAIAIVSSLGQDKPVERMCALSLRRDEQEVDVALLVKSHPIRIEEKRFLLLTLQDITKHQQRAALERTFFHDVNNMLTMLIGATELLVLKEPSELARRINKASLRLHKEIAIQRHLSETENGGYQPMRHEMSPEQTLAELRSFFASHPVAFRKKIVFQEECPKVLVHTDITLMLRVLCNMVLNALEATEENGVVQVWAEQGNGQLSFCVWNAQEIPNEVAKRIFQRNFSTKEQAGRGIGTFSMKLFGEQILGGKVGFSSSREEGTVFRFSLAIT